MSTLYQVSDEIYKLVSDFTKESTVFIEKVLKYLINNNGNNILGYASLRNMRNDKLRFKGMRSPSVVCKELVASKVILIWTRQWKNGFSEELEVLIEKSNSLIKLINTTDHSPVDVVIHKSKEAYELYMKEQENK